MLTAGEARHLRTGNAEHDAGRCFFSGLCLAVNQGQLGARGRPCPVAGRLLWPSGPKLHSGAGCASPSMAALACNAGSQGTGGPFAMNVIA